MSSTEYAKHASGLYVPEEFRRGRQVWSKEEWKLLDRATRMVGSHGVKLLLACQEAQCQGKPMERLRRPDGGITLRCEHLDREVWKL